MNIISIILIKNENTTMCSTCGGDCCKTKPGVYHPDQLFKGYSDIKARVHELLDSGNFIMVRNTPEGVGDKAWFDIQPRASFYKNKLAVDTFGGFGTCINLTSQGCTLSFTDRPLECQSLIPKTSQEGKCHYLEGSRIQDELKTAWRRYYDILDTVNEERWDKYAIHN